ncbi:MAG TPA: Vms1/Ankzf1 family peptidyl-tRNA hydrolase [Gaiellaceae bacterium]|nr:Vms1/Ankzf1 family peptidyl-tRNA hydrolase [Gaiellaceae bacterium]
MAVAVTNDILRDLAAFEAEGGCALSIYVDLDPSSTPTPAEARTRLNALLAEAEKTADGHARRRDCRLAVADDLERISTWWENELDRAGARSLAIFASSADDFFRTVPLSEGVSDGAYLAAELYLRPLAGQLGSGDGALVVLVSRERGVLYRLAGGRLVEVADETDDLPGRHDQGGWSQARYQRHIEKLVKDHLKSVGNEVAKRMRGGNDLVIVGVAPEEVRAEFEQKLSKDVRAALIGWTSAEAHVGPVELLEAVRPLLDEAHARHEQETIERYQEERGRGSHASAGWKQTLDAASDARVEVLLLEPSEERPAWRCPRCGRASADGGKCPLDDTKLAERLDGADLAIHQTLLHGGTVLLVGQGRLGNADGIGALLRF